MLNQYVNMTPQQKMAQMLQQQAQPTQLQGQQEMPQMMGQQAQNPFGGVQDAMKMYQQASQQNNMQDMRDYMARLKLGQAQTGGMFDSANVQAPAMTANNYTG
jgi:nitrogen-specific signal transduction histidine kinase